MEQSLRDEDDKLCEKIARAMAENDGDIINNEWAGAATQRLWMRRARIAVEVMRGIR